MAFELIFEIVGSDDFCSLQFEKKVLNLGDLVEDISISFRYNYTNVVVVVEPQHDLDKLMEFRLIRSIVSVERFFPVQIISIS